jgi:hypothetical protein
MLPLTSDLGRRFNRLLWTTTSSACITTTSWCSPPSSLQAIQPYQARIFPLLAVPLLGDLQQLPVRPTVLGDLLNKTYLTYRFMK